jgi:regulatory protein
LAEKKISPETVEKTLAYLEKNRYIDDPRFALQFGRSRIENKRVGKLRLRRELRNKGLDDSLINKTLNSLYAERDESEIALACAKRKLALFGPGDTQKKRGRLARFLERQGYSASIVCQVVNRLIPHIQA